MKSTSRLQPCPCSCYKLGTDCIEFRKIAESQDRGLAIYQYIPETNDERPSESSEAFILSSNKNAITREDITTVFEYSKMTCPRCIKIVKHAESLVTNVQLGEVQDVLGVCDHCRLKERLRTTSSCRCKEVVKKFTTNAKEKREAQRNRVKRWLTQVQHLLKNASIGDSKGYKLKKRARSELSLDKLFSDFNRSEPKYYKEESRAEEKLKTSAQLPNTARTSSFSERVDDVYTDAKTYLKRVTKSVKHRGDTSEPSFIDFPQDKQIDDIAKPGFSKSEDRQLAVSKLGEIKMEHKKFTSFLERSEENFEPKPKHKMLSILKFRENEQFKKQEKNEFFRKPSLKGNRLKAVSEQDVSSLGKAPEFTSKSKTSLEGGLMPSLEKQTSLLPEMPWTKSSSEQNLSRNFSFLFPKEKIEIIERHTSRISSADIIKNLQDTLRRKAEEEQRKKEEELKRKHEEKERTKLEKKEKSRIEAEKKILADEEKKRITEKTPNTTEKAEKTPQKTSKDQIIIEEKGQESGEKQEKLQNQKTEQKSKADKIQKQKLEAQDKLKKGKDSSKQDKEEIQTEKAKIAEAKLAEKEAQKVLKEQQKKEKEERAQKAESEKIKAQQKLKQDKAEKLNQKLEEKDSLKKAKDDRLQKDADNTAKTDKVPQKDATTKKDNVTQKDETAKKDIVTQKDETTKKDNVTQKDETAKKGETTKKDETIKESGSDKKGEEDKQTQRAANDELKALLALQEKDKAEREKLKKQQEIEKELAEKKAMEAERMAKEAKNTNKHDKQKEVKDKPVKSEETPSKKPESPPPPKDLAFKDVKVRKQSGDDLILRLVKLKQNEPRHRESYRFSRMHLPDIFIKTHARHKCKDPKCPVCRNSELGLDYDECLIAAAHTYKPEEITDIIIGEKIYKNTTPYRKPQEKEKETMVEFVDETECTVTVKKEDEVMQESLKETVQTKQLKGKNDLFDPDSSKGVIRYALSDRAFIDKGWTMLPTEKVVRKMNVYRMRPAHPEFDWFEHNKYKRLMEYDTGEKLAEFDDNGRGRWFYRSGKLALDYYDAEEINAQQRFVVYSSGEPDERGRTRPRTILATFDYLGNGIVFDHAGKIRLKYNQTEGVLLDRSIGPVSQWKWHTLNDPPVLQQVMIDTQMPYKDPTIMKLGGPGSAKKRVDNEEMLAIEFDNFIKEKSRKLTQKFKPFQIRMKALKINEYFSLRVLDQASVYLLYRDGTTNLKINMGMILDHKEIVDTDTADVGDVSNSMERLPARTDSLAILQQAVAQAQSEERSRVRHERRLHKPADPCASAERLTAAASRPLRPPLVTASGTTVSSKCPCKLRKPPSNLYYDTRL
ncbi:uncharacterized protein isoform X2 [Choristoneura fumiferana]|uniref:uncharacterized protein isoform X2 n=1 Tax=Choristoneura fumiferana TaxID=7141 RepID=UPI003D15C2DC